MVILKIRTPYYGAGTVFAWDQEKWGIRGVGLSVRRIDKAIGDVLVKIDSENLQWRVKAETIASWAKHHESIDNKKGTPLYVVPLKLLQEHHHPFTSQELVRMAR